MIQVGLSGSASSAESVMSIAQQFMPRPPPKCLASQTYQKVAAAQQSLQIQKRGALPPPQNLLETRTVNTSRRTTRLPQAHRPTKPSHLPAIDTTVPESGSKVPQPPRGAPPSRALFNTQGPIPHPSHGVAKHLTRNGARKITAANARPNK